MKVLTDLKGAIALDLERDHGVHLDEPIDIVHPVDGKGITWIRVRALIGGRWANVECDCGEWMDNHSESIARDLAARDIATDIAELVMGDAP